MQTTTTTTSALSTTFYRCWDESGCEVTIEAATAADAARSYVDAGDWADIESTIWIRVIVRELDEHGQERVDEDGDVIEWEDETVLVDLDPPAPRCTAEAHDWQSPHSVVRGLKENPGVWGHGGGVVVREVCGHCGCYRTIDTWAQDSSTGIQGLESVAYEPADETSIAWLAEAEEGE